MLVTWVKGIGKAMAPGFAENRADTAVDVTDRGPVGGGAEGKVGTGRLACFERVDVYGGPEAERTVRNAIQKSGADVACGGAPVPTSHSVHEIQYGSRLERVCSVTAIGGDAGQPALCLALNSSSQVTG